MIMTEEKSKSLMSFMFLCFCYDNILLVSKIGKYVTNYLLLTATKSSCCMIKHIDFAKYSAITGCRSTVSSAVNVFSGDIQHYMVFEVGPIDHRDEA